MKKFSQLAEECSLVSPKTKSQKEFKQVWFTRPELKKFAALMLNEALEIVEENHRAHKVSMVNTDLAFNQVKDDLKKHFSS